LENHYTVKAHTDEISVKTKKSHNALHPSFISWETCHSNKVRQLRTAPPAKIATKKLMNKLRYPLLGTSHRSIRR